MSNQTNRSEADLLAFMRAGAAGLGPYVSGFYMASSSFSLSMTFRLMGRPPAAVVRAREDLELSGTPPIVEDQGRCHRSGREHHFM
jgi:hypothetical protein